METTFIFGAGASVSYRYPIGSKLIYDLSLSAKRAIDNKDDAFEMKQLEEFKRTLLPSRIKSIDLYLKTFPQFRDFGYRMITSELVGIEQNEPHILFNNQGPNVYASILDFIKDAPNMTNDELQFITFNYDRALDHMLFEYIYSRWFKNEWQILDNVNKFSISHVYGQLGYLPWQIDKGDKDLENQFAFGYGDTSVNLPEKIQIASRTLRTVYDEENKIECETDKLFADKFKTSLEKLKESERIIIIGFGYLEENFKALGFDNIDTQNKDIYGTSVGISEKQKAILTEKYNIQFLANDLESFLGKLQQILN
jgi:hypothetical protein